MTSSHISRAHLLIQHNRYEEAIKEVRQGISADPENAELYRLLALCLREMDQFDQAIQAARESISIEPENPYSHYTLSICLYALSKYKEAHKAIDEAIRLHPYETSFFHVKGMLAFAKSDWKSALDHALKGLELDPEDVNCINLRAQALVKLNRKAEAQNTVDYALERDPENSYSHANSGWTKIERDDYDGAIRSFLEALRIDPMNEYAREGLKEAIKGKNILYRGVLKYFLWMAKKSQQGQWFLIIGLYLGYRGLLILSRSNPALAPLLYPLIIVYILFAFSTWIARPVSNALLLFHPVGKHALSTDEKIASGLVTALGIGAVALLIGFYFTGMELFLLLGGLFFLMTIPVGGTFNPSPDTKARKILSLYSIALFGVGLVAIFLPGGGTLLTVFLVGFIAFQFIANFLISKE